MVGAAGIAGEQHERGVVAWLGAKVNLGHGASLAAGVSGSVGAAIGLSEGQPPQRVPRLVRRVADQPRLARHVADRQHAGQRVLGGGVVVVGHVLGDGEMRHDVRVDALVRRVVGKRRGQGGVRRLNGSAGSGAR